MKKVLAALMVVVLLLALLPAGMVSAVSGPLSLEELQKMYPHGAYWNHTGSTNKPYSYTWTPCNHHTGNCTYSGSCGCNSYNGKAIQCMGFAYQLASLAYDCDPRSEWTTNNSSSALNKLKAGDIVRYNYNGHSIFVTAVDGNTVTYVDGNGDNRCQIRWGQTITKSKLKASFTYVKVAPYALDELPAPEPESHTLTMRYHAGGGGISAPVAAHQYTVTDPDGVNLRAKAGTGHSVLTSLSVNTVFTVKVGDTKTANGYTWGKTTCNGFTGWVVVSDFVTKTAELTEGDYYLVDSVVHRTDTATPVIQTVIAGEDVELSNPATFGLTHGNRPFMGWSTQPEGTEPLYAWDVVELKAEVLCPALIEKDVTLTLYAVWGCDHAYETPCAPKCGKCGEQREVVHTYDDACDPECNLCATTREPEHVYDNACDPECGACKAKRETTHLYDTECTETCSVCGETRLVKLHDFKENVCTVCGKVMVPLSITTQPKTGYAKMGEKVTVAVEAVGDGLTYQWFVKNEGKTKYTKSSITAATYTTTMSDKSKNRRVLCYVYDQYGNQVYSKSVLLREAVGITTQPKTGYAKMGKKITVAVEATGDGLTYQWFVKNEGKTKYTKSSVTDATYTTTMSDKSKNRRVLCYVYDQYGNKVQSKSVLLREAVSIVTEPQSITVEKGKMARVTVTASGDGLTYRWYLKNAGGTKYGVSSITTATYSVKMSDKANGRRLICYVYDKYGNKVQSKTVTVKMK